ncbi:MAG: TonB-dependent receptor [Saprospiraceae bacterium]
MFIAVFAFGQTTLSGTITDPSSNEPLIGASVLVVGTSQGTITDFNGAFSIDTEVESGKIRISYTGHETTDLDFNGSTNFNQIELSTSAYGLEEVVVTGVMDIVRDRKTPVAVSTITIAEIQAKGVGNVEFPETMKNTPSVYVSGQTGFGDSQMFLRGFGQTNTAFLLNGQPINGMEDGRMYWSNWSGMSDVANAVQVQRGLGSSKLAISSVGGTINIVTKTVDNQKGGYARAMVGNGNYLKGTVAYNTGLQGKWAFSMLLDHWQADRKWADGTPGRGQNYFFSVGYKPNDKNTFNFLVTGAPQWHGQRWSQSQETLDENPRFNQHWGELDGEFFTERRNFYHKPVINFSWDSQLSDKTKLSSVAYASFGRGGGTGNYGSSRNRIRTEDGQIDWDAIQANNEADDDGIGSFGSNYARRASMNNHQWYGNVTSLETALTDNISWSVGADFRWYTGDHFRQLTDIFGLNSYQDSFRHATRGSDFTVSSTFDPGPWNALFNFASEEERIAYDYSEDINYQGAFTQLEYSNDVISAFLQGAVSNQSYQRMGRWADQGESEKVAKIGYNIKAGASYSFAGSSTIFGNVGTYSRQPFLDNIFENIRYSNDLIAAEEDIQNEEVVGVEIGYKYESKNFRANINAYSTSWQNRTFINVGTNDNGTEDNEDDDFNQRTVERGIGQIHNGIEGDFQYRTNKLRLRGFTSIGDWTYNNIERVTVFNDDTGLEISDEAGLDINGVNVPRAPQFTIGAGAKYELFDGFNVDVDFNFYDGLWRRDNFNSGDVVLRADIGELDSYALVDASVSYRFNVGGNDLIWRANIYNLLNNNYIVNSDAFGLVQGNGITWNTSVKFMF